MAKYAGHTTLLALALVGIVACAETQPTTPTVSAFALTGVVIDSAPSNRPLAGVTLTVVDGPWAGSSTVTNANGEFAFEALNGSLKLSAISAGYQSETITVDMTSARNVRLTLRPEPKRVDETLTRALSSPGPCGVPCRSYTLDIHNDGNIEATLTWPTFTTGLKLSLWRGDTLMMTSAHAGTQRQAFLEPVPVSGGFAYQLRVAVVSGAEPPRWTGMNGGGRAERQSNRAGKERVWT